MDKPAMTPTEAHREIMKFRDEIGGEADIYIGINVHGISGTIYPDGIVGNTHQITYRADDVADIASIIAGMRALWDESSGRLRRELIRKMALEIITITADQGRCSDAALRMKFKANDIKRYGPQAVEEANSIAGRGPFSIEVTGGRNAPADVEMAS